MNKQSTGEWHLHRELIYIPLIALILLGLTVLWDLKIKQTKIKSLKNKAIIYLCLSFNVWGLDVIQREFNSDSWFGILKICLGAWLVFVVATNVKHSLDNGWSKREFWLNYGGDLANFIVAGALLHLAT